MAFDPANRGGAGGSTYTQRSTSVPGVTGNWNTGGQPVSTGSFASGGYNPIGQPQTNRVGMPVSNQPRIAPVAAPPVQMTPPTPAYPVPVRLDPGIIAQLLKGLQRPHGTTPPGSVGPQYGGEFPGIPISPSPGSTIYKQPRGLLGNGYGNDQFGRTFGGPRN